MAGRHYPRTTIEEFGKLLIESGDLDPIYVALHRLALPQEQLHKWLLAYWCFYSAGVASYLSEQPDGEHYWHKFMLAAHNVDAAPHGARWERGKERRHFRGKQAVAATFELQQKYPVPEYAIADLAPEAFCKITGDGGQIVRLEKHTSSPIRIPYKTVLTRAKQWRGFGDWISYKVGDMLDRCGVVGVDFAFDDAMYKDPTVAALMLWKFQRNIPQESTIDDPKAAVAESVAYLISAFAAHRAPPLGERPIGYQEIETILCKWKSHLNGHYPYHNDIHEIHEGSKGWAPHCKTAAAFLEAMPKAPAEPYKPTIVFIPPPPAAVVEPVTPLPPVPTPPAAPAPVPAPAPAAAPLAAAPGANPDFQPSAAPAAPAPLEAALDVSEPSAPDPAYEAEMEAGYQTYAAQDRAYAAVIAVETDPVRLARLKDMREDLGEENK